MHFDDRQLGILRTAIVDSMNNRGNLTELQWKNWRFDCQQLLNIIRGEMERRGMYQDDHSEDNNDLFRDN